MGAPHFQEGACGSPPIQETPRPAFPQVSQKGGRWETFPMEPPSPRGVGSVGGEPPTLGGASPWNTVVWTFSSYIFPKKLA